MLIASNSPDQNAPTYFHFIPEDNVQVYHNVSPFEVVYNRDAVKEDVAVVLIMRNDKAYKDDDWYYDRLIFDIFDELHPEFEIKFINQLGGKYNALSNG